MPPAVCPSLLESNTTVVCTSFLQSLSTYVHTPTPHSVLRFRPAPKTPDLHTFNLPLTWKIKKRTIVYSVCEITFSKIYLPCAKKYKLLSHQVFGVFAIEVNKILQATPSKLRIETGFVPLVESGKFSAFFVTPTLPAPCGVVASSRLCCLSRVPPAVCPSLLESATTVCTSFLRSLSTYVRTYADASFHITIQARSTNTRVTYIRQIFHMCATTMYYVQQHQ